MKLSYMLAAFAAAMVIGVGFAYAGADLSHLNSAMHLGLSPDAMLAMTFLPMAGREAHALVDRSAMPLVHARARGVMSVRADASDATKIFAELKTAVEAMRAEHEKEIADLKKGMGDVVQSEKVDRINADIGKLQAALDQVNSMIAAAKIGGAGNDTETADQREHAKAFDRYFRKGAENGLRELEVKAAASSSSDPDGGYTVSKQVESTIDRVLSTVSAMRRIARVVSVSSSVYKKVINQGGTTSGWVGEKDARTETNTSQLSALEFPVMELYANPGATQGLLDDGAVDIAAWLAGEVDVVFAEQEGAAFITGTGSARPRGILSYDTVANASYSWGKLGYIAGGVAAALSDGSNNGVDKLIDLTMALKQGYRTNANWLMNRATAAVVRKFKDSQGRYLWEPSVQVGQPAVLLGYPVADDDNMSDIGANAFPIAFGDFQRGYLIVDRQGIRVLRDPYTNKPYVMFYTTKRVGGGVQNFEAIKLMKVATS